MYVSIDMYYVHTWVRLPSPAALASAACAFSRICYTNHSIVCYSTCTYVYIYIYIFVYSSTIITINIIMISSSSSSICI